ncbi:MAG: hypothetical protein IJS01_10745 [Lentisphaeria bacterium]|nr:hypothetical protein [Lentisphaeria bacterium]
MIEDIYEPLSRYRDEFREKFSRLTAEKFNELEKESRVDASANAALVAEIEKNTAALEEVKSRRTLWGFLTALAVLLTAGGVGAAIYGIVKRAELRQELLIGLVAGGIAGAVVFLLLMIKLTVPRYRQADEKAKELEQIVREKTEEAWRQMAPLNELFDWRITADLITRTVPRIEFDPFFTEARLRDLRESFGWDDKFNERYSVVNAHSGVINDNPFVFAELLRQDWEMKRYTGHLEISWTETVRDSDGKTRTVRRYQTLTAHVEKPAPVYPTDKMLIFGNDAAPDLVFSREPSGVAGGKGFFNSLERKSRLNELKRYARNLDDESNFTMMSNEEFEVLFHAKDRSDEVGFRLLFTPLAQQQMVDLLNDAEVGFGDDFRFIKRKKINFIMASHLDGTSFSDDPEQFCGYDLESMRKNFQTFNEAVFKSLYFALAPLLIVPLYQQIRTRQAIYGEEEKKRSTFWEHEAIANYYGGKCFAHPQSITQNILKTRCVSRDDAGAGTVEVTASGFRGEDRVDHVSVYGGDGRFHAVPVPWVEYLPVQKTSSYHFVENPDEKTVDLRRSHALLRRSIYTFFK